MIVRDKLIMKTHRLSRWGILFLLLAIASCSVHAQLSLGYLSSDQNTGRPLGTSDRNVVVLIHGWNPSGSTDSFATVEFTALINGLKHILNRTDWKLVLYHWETDANTGAIWDNNSEFVTRNATQAAERGFWNGKHLGQLLNEDAPDLRKVHFIAHSAGSWAAREAMLELMRSNPYAICQLTLLDPFIPNELPGISSALSTTAMSLTYAPGDDRIIRLENYFSDDSISSTGHFDFTLGTQETFSWGSRGYNLRVDHGSTGFPGVALWYDYHAGPIQFYSDTAHAAAFNNILPGLETISPAYNTIGWYRSLFRNTSLPVITSHPESQIANPGGSVTLSVAATSPQNLSYQWYRNGRIIIGAENASYTFTAFTGSPSDYAVKVENATGPVFSEIAVVSVYSSVPTITSVSPGTLQPSGSAQTLTIRGTNFKGPNDPNASRLVFYDPANNPTPLRTPTFVNAGELTYGATLPVAGTWKVKVVNGSAESLLYSFTVSSGTVQLTGLSITGPATVNENSSAQFVARAIISDGTTPTVNPSWSVNSGSASISASGLFSANSVNANSQVAVTASYTSGGITKSTTANITILDLAGGSGFVSQQLLVNPNFANGGSGWTLTGNFQADARFQTCLSCPGYAYLANADGTPGNNLSGTLSQTVTIPANAAEATLSFWHRTTTSETGGAFDRLNVQLRFANNSLVGLVAISNTDANVSYAQRSIDLTSYRGQTVTIEFLGMTDVNAPTTFRVDDVTLTARVPAPPTPVSLAISGPSSVVEGGTGQYSATMIYSDGSIGTVAALTWGNNNPSLVSFTSGGLMSAEQVNQDTTVSIYTAAQVGGQTYEAFKDVRIVDQPNFTSLTISGPTSLNENSSRQYTATANFSDGSAQTVSPSWSVTSGPGTISAAGSLSVGELLQDEVITVRASFTIGSTTRTDTYQVLALNTSAPATLVTLAISGPDSIVENTAAQYTGVATLSDGSSIVVNPTWSLVSSFASISQFGLLSVGEVPAAASATVSASYTIAGITRTASKQVAILKDANSVSGPYEAKWARALNTFRLYASAPAQGGGMVLFGTFTGTLTAGGQSLTANGAPSDFYGVKLNANHEVVWVKQYGGSAEETVDSCAQHPQGGWEIAGTFQGTASIGGAQLVSSGNRDAYLARLDENGNVLWAKRGGGGGIDYGKNVGVDGAGNCYLFGVFTTSATFTGGGQTLSATGTRFDIFVAKYSAGGDFQWARSGGGPDYDELYCAKVDAAGNAYVGGTFQNRMTWGSHTLNVVGTVSDSNNDAYLAKLAPNGDVLWAKRFGQSEGDQGLENMSFISPAADGSCFFGGMYVASMIVDGQALPGSVLWKGFAGKVNSSGTVEWLRATPSENIPDLAVYFAFSSIERGTALPDGGLAVVGRYKGRLPFGPTTITNSASSEYQFVAKFDSSGTAQWAVSSSSAGLYYVDSVFPAAGERIRLLARATGQNVGFPGIEPLSAPGDDAVLIEFGPPEIVIPPLINVTLAGGKIVIAWPASSTGFTLEWANQLPSTTWTANSAPSTLVGGNFVVTNELSGGAKFFRLRK
jgi:hypothetical protein